VRPAETSRAAVPSINPVSKACFRRIGASRDVLWILIWALDERERPLWWLRSNKRCSNLNAGSPTRWRPTKQLNNVGAHCVNRRGHLIVRERSAQNSVRQRFHFRNRQQPSAAVPDDGGKHRQPHQTPEAPKSLCR